MGADTGNEVFDLFFGRFCKFVNRFCCLLTRFQSSHKTVIIIVASFASSILFILFAWYFYRYGKRRTTVAPQEGLSLSCQPAVMQTQHHQRSLPICDLISIANYRQKPLVSPESPNTHACQKV